LDIHRFAFFEFNRFGQ